MERQSNDRDEAGINDGDRFINSSVGNEKGNLTSNSHVRDNGLNDKNVKVEEGNKVKEKENSYVRSNGLNHKNLEIAEKGEKVVRKEKENSLVRDNGLNNKIIEMAAEWNESRAASECKFRMQRRRETEAEEDEYGRRWSRHNQNQNKWRNETISRTSRHEPRMTFTVGSVSDEESEYRNSFVQNNGLNKSNPIHKLEDVLRICYQEKQSQPDMFGLIRRNPRVESNPLLCNLKDRESTQDSIEAVTQIIDGMLNKIPERQIECSTIRGIGSHRITRFDLVETEVIQERIMAIRNGSKSGRRAETLADDEVSVYDEGRKDYIESTGY